MNFLQLFTVFLERSRGSLAPKDSCISRIDNFLFGGFLFAVFFGVGVRFRCFISRIFRFVLGDVHFEESHVGSRLHGHVFDPTEEGIIFLTIFTIRIGSVSDCFRLLPIFLLFRQLGLY